MVVLVLFLYRDIAEGRLFATTDVAREEAARVRGRQDGWCIVWKNERLFSVEELMRIGLAPVLFGIHDVLVPLGRRWARRGCRNNHKVVVIVVGHRGGGIRR